LLNDSGKVVAEVFRSDANNSLEVSLFDDGLPFVEVERLFRIARTELGAFEDGTALPTPLA
ncbi:ATPase, partial [Ralstonia solanacearum]